MSSKYRSRRTSRQTVNDGWSPAEDEVICLLLSGRVACGKEIARELRRPVPTVYEQLRRIRGRIGVRSNAQAVAVLMRERMAV
jgi:DNA-binding CsgD family transcriptional regulator